MNRWVIVALVVLGALLAFSALSWAKAVGIAEAAKRETEVALAAKDSVERVYRETRERETRRADSLARVSAAAEERAARLEAAGRRERERAAAADRDWQRALVNARALAPDSAGNITHRAALAALEAMADARDREVGAWRAAYDSVGVALTETRAALAASREETAAERRIRVQSEALNVSLQAALDRSQQEARAWESAATGARNLFGLKVPASTAFVAGVLGGAAVGVVATR